MICDDTGSIAFDPPTHHTDYSMEHIFIHILWIYTGSLEAIAEEDSKTTVVIQNINTSDSKDDDYAECTQL